MGYQYSTLNPSVTPQCANNPGWRLANFVKPTIGALTVRRCLSCDQNSKAILALTEQLDKCNAKKDQAASRWIDLPEPTIT